MQKKKINGIRINYVDIITLRRAERHQTGFWPRENYVCLLPLRR